MPSAFAEAIPYIAFKTIAPTLFDEAAPVVLDTIISLPKPGVITLPTVATPMGKL